MIFDNDVIEKYGRKWRVNIEADDDFGPPWENADGHGPVSGWTSRDKRPGEWTLCADWGVRRYYDAAEANRMAKRDCWGLNERDLAELRERINGKPWRYIGSKRLVMPEHARDGWCPFPVVTREPTRGEIRAEAVRRDFEYLRSWCNDGWHYVGVIVTDVTDDEDARNDYGHALWGIESNSDDYIEEIAHELIDGAAREFAKEVAEAEHWACRDVETV